MLPRTVLGSVIAFFVVHGVACDPCYPKTDADLRDVVDASTCDWLYVEDTSLTNLEALRGLESVGIGIIVRRNAALNDVSALGSLNRIPQVQIEDNAALAEISLSVEGETGTDAYISIRNNPTSSIALALGPELGGLTVTNLSPLASLNVEGLQSMRTLRLEDLPALEDLRGLGGITSVSVLNFRRLPGLSTAEVDAFVQQLQEAPIELVTCGLADSEICEGDDATPLEG